MDELMKEMKALWETQKAELKTWMAKYDSENSLLGKASDETKATLGKIAGDMLVIGDRILACEQRLSKPPAGSNGRIQSVGERFINSDQVKSAVSRGSNTCSPVNVVSFHANISGDTTASVALPPAERMELFADPKRPLRVRDLLTVVPTQNTSIEYVKYTFDNKAAPIYQAPSPSSPSYPVFEGVTKPESDMSFALHTASVRTIAHWIAASKQILMDLPQLRALIDTELRFGLALVEEAQLLTGDGTQANLNGLITQATSYDNAYNELGDTVIDKIRRAILQARIALYPVDGIVLNPVDWAIMETLKDTTGTGAYYIGNPQGVAQPRLWGKPVVESDGITAGTFLVGAFAMGARLYDREQASIDVSDSHASFFIQNMVAIRAEERLALVVHRPQAFIYGSF